VDRAIAADFQSSIAEPTFLIGEVVRGKRNVLLT
jgi:hypothetical protein